MKLYKGNPVAIHTELPGLNSNSEDQTAHQYTKVLQHYVFNNRSKRWVKRQRSDEKVISQMYSVSALHPEKFFLRLLLLHVPGACSYDDLKFISIEVTPTFHEVCIQLCLLTDDMEYDEAMAEASQFHVPTQLLSMFATVCTYRQLTDPMQLWGLPIKRF